MSEISYRGQAIVREGGERPVMKYTGMYPLLHRYTDYCKAEIRCTCSVNNINEQSNERQGYEHKQLTYVKQVNGVSYQLFKHKDIKAGVCGWGLEA